MIYSGLFDERITHSDMYFNMEVYFDVIYDEITNNHCHAIDGAYVCMSDYKEQPIEYLFKVGSDGVDLAWGIDIDIDVLRLPNENYDEGTRSLIIDGVDLV